MAAGKGVFHILGRRNRDGRSYGRVIFPGPSNRHNRANCRSCFARRKRGIRIALKSAAILAYIAATLYQVFK